MQSNTPPFQYVQRKPVPAAYQTPPPPKNDFGPVPINNGYPNAADGNGYSMGLAGTAGPAPPPYSAQQQFIPAPPEKQAWQQPQQMWQQQPQEPQQLPQHAMLRKVQKMPQGPPPPPPPAPQGNQVQHGAHGYAVPETGRQRSHSLQQQQQPEQPQPQQTNQSHGNRLQPRKTSPVPEPRGRSLSAQPPAQRGAAHEHARVVSASASQSRPNSLHSSDGGHSPSHSTDRGRLRRSWLPGGRSRSNSHDNPAGRNATAWIMSPDNHAEYNTTFLSSGEKVPELWNESGSLYVYLFPQGSRYGPSFKVPGNIVAASTVFNHLLQTIGSPASGRSRGRSFGGRDSLSVEDAARRTVSPPNSPPIGADGADERQLYVPPVAGQSGGAAPDLERLIAVRNLFAFLTGQPLVGTKAHSTIFSALLQIASLLREFGFTTYDGSSFGDAVDMSFGFFMEQLSLADVRHSREKTVEALVLGEHMKSWPLYNEAFAHAVGKYSALLDCRSPLFDRISLSTRRRLERAHIDLLKRQHNVSLRLESFEFPSLFAGVANSTSREEFRNVRFKNWRSSFSKMRGFIVAYYRAAFGHWPPKARSKKNTFSESGLNRQVLKVLYSDLCALYDLLVDREAITPRVIDQSPEDVSEGERVDPMIAALRIMLSEFDHSSPPVLPPVPFDVPKLPSMTSVLETYNNLSAKDQAKFDRRIQPHELQIVLLKSHDIDTDGLKVPFLAAFKEFELREARGCAELDMKDQRVGYWLFLYVVIQSLPMLVVDAPGLRFTDSVEYFLCEPPQGNPPWMEDAGQVRKVWYEVASASPAPTGPSGTASLGEQEPGTGKIVELSADVVMFSVEATYHRSHCWLAAKMWESAGADRHQAPPLPPAMSPLMPPHAAFQGVPDGNMQMPSPPLGPGMGTPPLTSLDGVAALPLRGRNASPVPSVSPNRMSRHPYRSSIAMGLEPLPGFTADGMPGDRSSRIVSDMMSPNGSQSSAGAARRSASAGNLQMMMGGQSGDASPSSQGGGGGSTFDDILKGMDSQDGGKKRSKFPF